MTEHECPFDMALAKGLQMKDLSESAFKRLRENHLTGVRRYEKALGKKYVHRSNQPLIDDEVTKDGKKESKREVKQEIASNILEFD